MFKVLFILCLSTLCYARDDFGGRRFPKAFLFGVASAHQLRSEHPNGSDVTKPNYKDEVAILRHMGVKFYNFSPSWPAILPSASSDKIDEAELNYYSSLINELIRHKIQPVLTIYRDKIPEKLQEIGGWKNELLIPAFEEYAGIIFDKFADRVKIFITVNNPYRVCRQYGNPVNESGGDEYKCAKNILLAHARAWRLYDNKYRKKNQGKVGISINVDWKEAASNETSHVTAAEDARQFYFGMYAHPIFSKHGDFPKEVKSIISKKSREQGLEESRLPAFTPEEVKLVHKSSDFFGLSHFTTNLVYRNATVQELYKAPSFDQDLNVRLTAGNEWATSNLDWLKSAPYGLYKALIWLNLNYDYPEILITEIGWSADSGIQDGGRVDYIRGYCDALLIALEDGARVFGMALRSLFDEFDPVDGYNAKFGLYEVDIASEKPKLRARNSALVYKEIIRSRVVDHNFKPGDVKISPERKQPKHEL